jgi:pilus assembly protein TadC
METLRTKIIPGALAILLYLVTLGLGLWDIYLIREIFLLIYLSLNPTGGPNAVFIADILVVILGLIFVGFAFVTAEFHRKHVNQAVSWKLFVQTLAVEAIFPLLAFFMNLGAAGFE